jgi:phenylpyruvate tautomerase PptA (4-oxalocrotonate tautomerase family)
LKKIPVIFGKVLEKKKTKTIIQGITKVFIDIDITDNTIEIIVNEIPKSN